MPVETQTVQGHIYQSDGSGQIPLVGATVRVVDWDRAGEDLLGETQTNENGYYRCQYDPAQYRSSAAEVGGPDLIVRVYNAQGHLLASSKRRTDAGPDETIDLMVQMLAPPANGRVVEGAVRRANGEPVVGMLVQADEPLLGGGSQELSSGRTDQNGAYRLTIPPARMPAST